MKHLVFRIVFHASYAISVVIILFLLGVTVYLAWFDHASKGEPSLPRAYSNGTIIAIWLLVIAVVAVVEAIIVHKLGNYR